MCTGTLFHNVTTNFNKGVKGMRMNMVFYINVEGDAYNIDRICVP